MEPTNSPLPQQQPAQAAIPQPSTSAPAATPPPLNAQANKKSLILIIGIIILVIILVVLSLLLLMRNSSYSSLPTTQTSQVVTPSVTAQLTPTKTPSLANDEETATQLDTGNPGEDFSQLEQDAAGL